MLATSAIMLSENKKRKRKIWSKKWYLKRNTSCEAHLLNGVTWYDAIVVSAGKLRKIWGSLSELRNSLCERRLERTVLRPAQLPVKIALFTQFFLSGMTSQSKISRFNWECTGRFSRVFMNISHGTTQMRYVVVWRDRPVTYPSRCHTPLVHSYGFRWWGLRGAQLRKTQMRCNNINTYCLYLKIRNFKRRYIKKR